MYPWCILLIALLVVTVDVNCKSKWLKVGEKLNEKEEEKKEEQSGNILDKIFKANEKIIKSSDESESGSSGFSIGKAVKVTEGDIAMTRKLERYLNKQKDGIQTKDSPFDAINNGAWPKGIVPYTFAAGFQYGSAVSHAIAEYNKKTCIRFRPKRQNERSYIEFMHGQGCWSYIGRQGGRQQISLGNGCHLKDIAIHEMMHALGFFHEQSRLDRDRHITIVWSNIRQALWYNFEKYKHGQASTLGEPYDKQSIMHYGNYAFSYNGRKTIISKSNQNVGLGQRVGLSHIDVRQLNKYYRCGRTTTTTTTTTTKRPTTTRRTTRRRTTYRRRSTRTTKKPVLGCNDRYSLCPTLANTARLCSNSWVNNNCKQSCKSCPKPPTKAPKKECKDKSGYCESWSKHNGHCRYSSGCCHNGNYTDFMKSNCQKSCKFC